VYSFSQMLVNHSLHLVAISVGPSHCVLPHFHIFGGSGGPHPTSPVCTLGDFLWWELKQPERESDCLPLTSALAKKAWMYMFTPPMRPVTQKDPFTCLPLSRFPAITSPVPIYQSPAPICRSLPASSEFRTQVFPPDLWYTFHTHTSQLVTSA
jgi:hypothetical protein